MSDRRVDVTFMIYGSYGVTGSLIVREALRRGHRPLLAGRDAGRLAAQADPLGLRWVAVDLGDRAGLERALRQVSAVLLVAGPFATTGRAMIEACIATGTSYVDTNGELDFFVVAQSMSAAARDARATLVSGAGFGVTAADCLALHVARRLPDARSIEVAVAPSNAHRSVAVSLSTLAVLSGGGAAVRDGRVVRERIAEHTRRVEVDGAWTSFASAPLAEAFTTFHTTGIRDVIALAPMARGVAALARIASPALARALRDERLRRLLERRARAAEATPTPAHSGARSWVWARARSDSGATATSMLTAGEGFAFAAAAAVRAVEKVAGSTRYGAFTPASAFGADHVLEIEGVRRRDLP